MENFVEKTLKKVVDKRQEIWYINQALRRTERGTQKRNEVDEKSS